MELVWDIYEINSPHAIHGAMLRGRIRKYTIENNIVCFAENASDKENAVRLAVLGGTDIAKVIEFIQIVVVDATVFKVLESVANPVLSKLKVNDASRYSL